jgi:hypothetical protein
MLSADVTPNEAYQRGTSHVTVTRYLNYHLFFVDGRYWCPRWIDVRVWRDAAGQPLAEPIHFRVDKPWDVKFQHCACGQDFVMKPGMQTRVARCYACERTVLTRQQRARRRRQHARQQIVCRHCRVGISAARTSRRYCSGKCRIAAWRAAPR